MRINRIHTRKEQHLLLQLCSVFLFYIRMNKKDHRRRLENLIQQIILRQLIILAGNEPLSGKPVRSSPHSHPNYPESFELRPIYIFNCSTHSQKSPSYIEPVSPVNDFYQTWLPAPIRSSINLSSFILSQKYDSISATYVASTHKRFVIQMQLNFKHNISYTIRDMI